jgi:hypothetical protein
MEESYIWSKIQGYYGETKYNGSTKSIQDDRSILGKPFKRWYIAPAAMVFQAICGSVYAWSVFNLPVDNAIYGSDQVKKEKKKQSSSLWGLSGSRMRDDADGKRENDGRKGVVEKVGLSTTPDFFHLLYLCPA